jgi:hypothetical protein
MNIDAAPGTRPIMICPDKLTRGLAAGALPETLFSNGALAEPLFIKAIFSLC